MEETQVIIVGAGPSGLALGLYLAKYQVRSIILEKDTEITADPRGVWLTGDAIRIFHDLGMGEEMEHIGHYPPHVNYHHTSFATEPFFRAEIGRFNSLEQALPEGMIQMQPRLEKALRQEIAKSSWCTVRIGCEVINRSSEDPPTIEYVEHQNGSHRHVRGQWLIGADGKLGVVRKHFLEPTVGIKQLDGVYPYVGTWIASNLKMTLPTPETHPDFPLWKLGYSSDEVYNLFWPVGWHFCSPPGKATACGRFGPHIERMWRHEFCHNDDVSNDVDSEKLFWEHITPMITLDGDSRKGKKFDSPILYPRDCIQILRCRPFRFVHKVVDRWFHNKTIVIGDAAHVFPPFAGQGIASGVRDAQQLSWRLALLLKMNASAQLEDSLLSTWASERRHSVDAAASLSKINGTICNYAPSIWLLALLRIITWLESISFIPSQDPQGVTERKGFSHVTDGFHLKQYNGGARLAQIYLRVPNEPAPILSDTILQKVPTIFKLIVISDDDENEKMRLWEEACASIDGASIHSAALSRESILIYDPRVGFPTTSTGLASTQMKDNVTSGLTFTPAQRREIEYRLSPEYNVGSYIDRLGKSTKFVIARPDLFIFACASDASQLVKCIGLLEERLDGEVGL